MLRIIFVVAIWFAASSPMAAESLPVFHRLLAFNQQGELLVVKIKDRELWVTPGWYQDNNLTVKEGLEKLAGSYGLTISDLKLSGVFTLRMGKEQSPSTRLIYLANTQGQGDILPEGIDKIAWQPLTEALQTINLAHIRYQVKQIIANPQTVWGGTQKMRWEEGINRFGVVEDFYPLFAKD